MTAPGPRSIVLIAGGGTAGHLLPGIAVAEALVAHGRKPSEIHFVGGDRGVERSLVPPAGFSLDELPGRGIQRRLTLQNLSAAWGLVRGLWRGIGIVRRRRPAVVVVLGGYASFACGVGAVVCRVPLVLLEQNARAGAVNRALRRFCAASAVSFEGTDLPRAVVTGNPLRPEIVAAAERARADRDAARRDACSELGLPADRTVVAVTSGSLGSRRINTAVRGLADVWASRADLAIRHVVGRRDFADAAADEPDLPSGGLVYQLVEYEDRVDELLLAADVVVSRSGGSVAELAAVGVPAILVPLPIAPRDHQRANARSLVAAGGAVLVADEDCTPERLATELDAILTSSDRREAMAGAMRAAARPDAADRVARLIEEQARG